MRFEWDEDKRQATLSERGIDFADAARANWRRALRRRDTRKDYGEDR